MNEQGIRRIQKTLVIQNNDSVQYICRVCADKINQPTYVDSHYAKIHPTLNTDIATLIAASGISNSEAANLLNMSEIELSECISGLTIPNDHSLFSLINVIDQIDEVLFNIIPLIKAQFAAYNTPPEQIELAIPASDELDKRMPYQSNYIQLARYLHAIFKVPVIRAPRASTLATKAALNARTHQN